MMHNLKPYLGYRDSGMPWLGAVPAHWETRRLRNTVCMRVSNVDKHAKAGELPVRLCNYVDVYKSDRIVARTPFMRASATPDEIERFRLKIGDVLITKDSEAWNDIGVPSLVEYEADDLVCGYHLALLRPQEESLIGGYLARCFQVPAIARQLHVAANGVTRFGITQEAIKSALLLIPPLSEQASIVRFLDYADRQIRRYIRAKQQLIKLLKEQKQAITHQALTRGLNPDVRLKPSGVEWLGEVPEHWEVVKLGRLIQLTTGFPFKSESFTSDPGDVRLLRGINISPGHLRWESVVRWPRSEFEKYSGFHLQVGDVVLGMDRPVISGGTRVAMIGEQDVPSLLLQRVARIRPTARMDNAYVLALLQGKGFSEYLEPIFTGVSVPHISPEQIRSFPIAVPPLAEQRAIIAWLERKTADLDDAKRVTHREISLLREYRTRLIADVVTGKLDVRAAAETLPIGEFDAGVALDADDEQLETEDPEGAEDTAEMEEVEA